MPKLSDVLSLEENEELPHIFVYHPQSSAVFRYPDTLDDPKKVSPLLVMLWAKIQVLEREITLLEARVKKADEEPDNEEAALTDE